MRNIIFILFVVCFQICGHAQRTYNLSTQTIEQGVHETLPTRDIVETEEGLTVTYRFKNILLKDDPDFIGSSRTIIDGFSANNNESEPDVPFRWDTFFVSSDDVTVTVVDSSFVDFPLELSPAWPMENEDGVLQKAKPVKPYTGFFPLSPLSDIRTYSYRGEPLVDVCVRPLIYDYLNKTVRAFKEIKINIQYCKTPKKKAQHPLTVSSSTFLSNIALNWKPETVALRQATTATPLVNSHYLIVTVPKYVSAANSLAEWKRMLGFDVDIEMRTSWEYDSVKAVVMRNYDTKNTEYLAIIGGHNDVPGRAYSDYVTDTFYGDIEDSVQSYANPGIFRGRLLVSTSDEAEIVVNKIINYERNPPINDDFYNTGINCAFFQDGECDSIEKRGYTYTSELIRDRMLILGKHIHRVYDAPPLSWPKYWSSIYGNGAEIPDSLQKPIFAWDGNAAQINNLINNKAFYVLCRNHGGVFEWSSPSYTTTDMNDLDNGSFQPVVFSVCCSTGAFNIGNCFCEVMLKKYNAGCIGIFGATQEVKTDHDDVIAKGYFNAIWPSSYLFDIIPSSGGNISSQIPVYRLGQILDIGLHWGCVIKGSIFKVKTYCKIHCFGDPAMMMHTETPTPFTNASVTRQNGTITVNTGGEDGTIVFYNTNTNVVNSFQGTSCTFADNSNIVVCISGHNKIPYIDPGENSNTIYLQNETLTQGGVYQADYIKAGSNVTTTKPIGEINFLQGSYELIGNEIELHPGTTISTGASVEINNH